MIHPNAIKRRADADGLGANVVERDYILAHVLGDIARSEHGERMIFKGGTALRLCHFDDYRYSADLDFSLIELSAEEALRSVTGALTACRQRLDLPLLELTNTVPARIEYIGPLDAKPRQLKLDLAGDELVEMVERRPIACRYEDQEASECQVYALEEIAAEKLRCVMQRLQCRDLFDFYELIASGRVTAEGIWPAFEAKARHRGLEPDRFVDSFERRAPAWKSRWDGELAEYLGSFPHFDEALRAVRRELRFAFR